MDILEHYRLTGRTPLSMPFYEKYSFRDIDKIEKTWKTKYESFLVLLSQTEGEERLKLIRHGIGTFKRIIEKNTDYEVTSYFGRFINELEKLDSKPFKDWSNRYNKLINNCFKDVTLNDFNEIMNYRRLPNGKERIKWLGNKNEALYFQKHSGLTVKQLNVCFIHNDGTRFKENNRLATNPEKTFMEIFN